jgi:hypothetical protein
MDRVKPTTCNDISNSILLDLKALIKTYAMFGSGVYGDCRSRIQATLAAGEDDATTWSSVLSEVM